MHNIHSGYSVVAKLKKDSLDKTRAFLSELNKDPGNNPKLPFNNFQTTHFVNAVLIPEQQYQNELLPATLLFATSFSGPVNNHLEELIRLGGPGLKELFQNCEDFSTGAAASDNELKSFLKKYRRWETFYSGMQFLSKTEILRENALRTSIRQFIDKNQPDANFSNAGPAEIKKQIQEHVTQQPEFEWATEKQPRTIAGFITLYWSLILFSIFFLLLLYSIFGWLVFHQPLFKFVFFALLAIIAFVLTLVLSMRKYEKEPQFVAPRQPDKTIHAVAVSQQYPVLNTMCVSGVLKNGWLRPLIFKLALRAVIMLRGMLKIPTVYTARWIAFDKGKRLVFVSNFTNFTESYIRDFIDNAGSARKINLLFGQGNGYPPTKWFMGGGALDNQDAFINDVMINYRFTDFWYCPYMNLSIENINMNRLIFQGLFAAQTPDQIKNWLQLL